MPQTSMPQTSPPPNVMPRTWALAIDRDRPDRARIAPLDLPPLDPGQARLAVERFALTANNVTYASFGRAMRYWDFFPAPDPSADDSGRLPVWGFATVTESRAPGLQPGARVYGFLPAASHLTVTPTLPGPAGFDDAAPHRADLPAAYNRYAFAPPTPTPTRDNARALFEPLMLTAALLALHLQAAARGVQALTVTSASSKTALALAAILRDTPIPGLTVEGVTAARNLAFVAASGLYDRCASYDELGPLPAGATRLIVDIAGSAPVNRALHDRFAPGLVANIRVGGAHWTDSTPARDLPGPRPRFFFAPEALQQARRDDPQALATRLERARGAVTAAAATLITPRHLAGPEGTLAGWRDLVAGRVGPETGLIVTT